MRNTSAGGRESFLALEKRERALAVAMLVVVNVVATLGILLPLYLLFPLKPPPGWFISAVRGFLFGEVAWLATWFSFSGSTLRFRVALVLFALALYSFGNNFLIRLCAVLAMRWGTPFIDAFFSWSDAWQQFAYEFNEGLCFILFLYAILLPIRHFSGIVVATTELSQVAGRGRGQFQIQHWMIWAAIVAAPLALTSMTDIRRADGGVPLLALRLVTSATALVFALPVFLASLRQRRAAVWTGGTLLGLAITGIAGCELIRFSQSDFEWRTSITFLALSSFVICYNNLVLRLMGFRLRRVSQTPQTALSL